MYQLNKQEMVTVMRPVSSDLLRLRFYEPLYVTIERNGHRNRQSIYECCGNIPSVFRHLRRPRGLGMSLLGAHQMAEGVFLTKTQKATATDTKPVFIKRQHQAIKVMKPVSSRGCGVRYGKRCRKTPNDTGIVTLTECRVVSHE